jgi:Fur family transcriptional regulator, peroxide stress response regulator
MQAEHDFDPVTLLKTNGLRVTPQRISVLTYMNSNRMHVTADDIYHAIKDDFPSLSVATVYNTLKAFLDSGIVKELKFGDNASRFDLNMTPHHHLICERCGKMIDVYLPDLAIDEITAAHHFQTTEYHIEIKGICEECQKVSKTSDQDSSSVTQ